jgi:hypothetical protein
VRRLKTYSAASGYVYQYYYSGMHETRLHGQLGAEYVFDVTADRKTVHPIGVFLSVDALTAWEVAARRPLTNSERYGIAKVALFRAFDDREDPLELLKGVTPSASEIEQIGLTLGL